MNVTPQQDFNDLVNLIKSRKVSLTDNQIKYLEMCFCSGVASVLDLIGSIQDRPDREKLFKDYINAYEDQVIAFESEVDESEQKTSCFTGGSDEH